MSVVKKVKDKCVCKRYKKIRSTRDVTYSMIAIVSAAVWSV